MNTTRSLYAFPIVVFPGILTEAVDSAQGLGRRKPVRNDVDQDVFLMFNVVDENLSWYLEDNILSCSDPAGVDPEEPDFKESNLMHGEKYEEFGFILNGQSLGSFDFLFFAV